MKASTGKFIMRMLIEFSPKLFVIISEGNVSSEIFVSCHMSHLDETNLDQSRSCTLSSETRLVLFSFFINMSIPNFFLPMQNVFETVSRKFDFNESASYTRLSRAT